MSEPTGTGSAVNAKHGEWLRRAEVAEARAAELEALLREAYEEDHEAFGEPVGDLGERIHAALKPTGRYCTCLHDAPNMRGHDSDCPLATGGKDDA